MVAGTWTIPGRNSGTWTIEPIEGSVRLGPRQIDVRESIQPGDRVLTDAGARARLAFQGVGTVEIGAGSRVRVARTRPGAIQLILEGGNLDATISAPPGIFLGRHAGVAGRRSGLQVHPRRRRRRLRTAARHVGLGGTAVEGTRVAGSGRSHLRHPGGERAGHAVLRRRGAGVHRRRDIARSRAGGESRGRCDSACRTRSPARCPHALAPPDTSRSGLGRAHLRPPGRAGAAAGRRRQVSGACGRPARARRVVGSARPRGSRGVAEGAHSVRTMMTCRARALMARARHATSRTAAFDQLT